MASTFRALDRTETIEIVERALLCDCSLFPGVTGLALDQLGLRGLTTRLCRGEVRALESERRHSAVHRSTRLLERFGAAP